MSALAPTLEAFFTQRLAAERDASPHTVSAYRDTWRQLLLFAQDRLGKPPSQLDFADLDAGLVSAFLTCLETERGNSASTRNARLTAIRSLFRASCHPEHAGLIMRVLAIPSKRHGQSMICFLAPDEVDALLAAPSRSTWNGRRDHTLLTLAIQTGLRVSELTSLTISDINLGTGACVKCTGKGRKRRVTPLTPQTVAVSKAWLRERAGNPADPLFPSRRGSPLSTDAVAWLLTKHVMKASQYCPTLTGKNVTPHVLRHTCAMNLLRAGVDISVIALWLGHESVATTQIYIHADLALKEQALARTTPPGTAPGRYRPPDKILAFLEAL